MGTIVDAFKALAEAAGPGAWADVDVLKTIMEMRYGSENPDD